MTIETSAPSAFRMMSLGKGPLVAVMMPEGATALAQWFVQRGIPAASRRQTIGQTHYVVAKNQRGRWVELRTPDDVSAFVAEEVH